MTNDNRSFTSKNGELRIYDGRAAPAPWYLSILFTNGDFTGPFGRNSFEEILILDRQNTTDNMHYIEGSDARIMEPLAVSFSARVFDYRPSRFFREMLAGNTTVNSQSIATTKGSTQNDGANNNPTFQDSTKITYNLEFKLTAGAGGNSWENLVLGYNEVWFDPGEQTLNEGEDAVTFNISGQCYGTVTSATGDFTTGSDLASSY